MCAVLVESLEQLISVVRRIVVHYVIWVMRIDLVDVLLEFATLLSLNFLYFLEASRLNESPFCLQVRRKHLGELSTDVS